MNVWDFVASIPDVTIERTAETPTSWLLFTPEEVFKIHKPVRVDTADLTTPSSRQKALGAELKMGKIFSKTVYKKVRGLKTGGKVFDYALEMRRIPEQTNLLECLFRKTLTDADVRRLGQTLAKAHTKSGTNPKAKVYGSPDALAERVAQLLTRFNDETFSIFLPHYERAALEQELTAWVESHEKLLKERMNRRKVKHIHGDAHAVNVYVEKDSISFLDARQDMEGMYGDVLFDLAALTKDFRIFREDAHAARIIRAYAGKNLRKEEEELLRFYEQLQTLHRLYEHADMLRTGAGSPGDAEMVQRYRDLLRRRHQK